VSGSAYCYFGDAAEIAGGNQIVHAQNRAVQTGKYPQQYGAAAREALEVLRI
jgi:hypothetical protein